MGVTHGNGTDGIDCALDIQLMQRLIHFRLKWQRCRSKARYAHVHRHLLVFPHHQCQWTAGSFHLNLMFMRQALVMYETGETARTITAVLHFTAVGIENPVAEIHVRVAWRLNDQQLIKTHTEAAVGQLANLLYEWPSTLVDQVDHHEIVAKAMHLGEVQQHQRDSPSPGPAVGSSASPAHSDSRVSR